MVSFRFCFSPLTVGTYRIRPNVGEREMMAASNPLFFRESPHRLACSVMWRAYAIRPYIFLFGGYAVMDGIVYILYFAKNCRGVSHTP